MQATQAIATIQDQSQEAFARELQGWQDRATSLPPQSNDNDYFHGYCDRLMFEVRRDEALAAS